MRLAFLTPLPPAKTGIAVYSAFILPELAKRADVTAVVDQEEWEAPAGCRVIRSTDYDAAAFDAAIYQLGNNPYHEWIYRAATRSPGIAELHDVVLHHMIVEMTLAQGRSEEYAAVLRENHGAAGEAWARGRIGGYHDEIGNFLFPASRAVADRSRHVLVHNRYAVEVLRRSGCTAPITVLMMPFPSPPPIKETKQEAPVIGMFGFVTDAKRPRVVFRAFAEACRRDPRLRLLVVGEPAPNLDLDALAEECNIPAMSWLSTGYVSEGEFDHHLMGVDRVINLRYPSAGETSGALLRIVHAGKPIAVSDYGPFTDLPEGVAARIPLGEGEHEAVVDFMLYGAAHNRAAQDAWIRENTDTGAAVDTYLRAAESVFADFPSAPIQAGLPLFPDLRLEDASIVDGSMNLTLANGGSGVVWGAEYGLPAYRLIVKLYRDGEEIFERWTALPTDLRPGARTTLRIATKAAGGELRLYHAMQGVPDIDRPPFVSIRIGS